MPTRDELATWAKNYAELWNAGDKEAWIANWKKVCYGDFKMWDPVGTPPKFDFERLLSRALRPLPALDCTCLHRSRDALRLRQ